MAHQIVIFENGQASIRCPDTGEPMHSRLGPWAEAMRVHIEPSRLAERLEVCSPEPLVVLDLGLGIAANALAAIELTQARAVKGLVEGRRLQIVSVETQLEGLRLALEHPETFPFLANPENRFLVRNLLEKGRVSSSFFDWELYLEDFRTIDLSRVRPEIVFFDFYSPRSAPELWTADGFKRLAEAGTEILTTYSAATAARAAMMLGGFYVGEGGRAGDKAQTTVAAKHRKLLDEPLSKDWLKKFRSSNRPLPMDWPCELHSDAERVIAPKLVNDLTPTNQLK